MKQLVFIFCILLGAILSPVLASAQNTSGALLKKMTDASQILSYEFYYVNVSKLGIDSLRYRHSLQNGKLLVQLTNMDGPPREVVMRGVEVSYFEPGIEPFSIRGDHIVDSLPSLVFANITRLEQYYDFVSVGRSRIADRICEVIRVVPRDGLRYNYVIWIDSETMLPLRADLLDRDGDTLEQFRVVDFSSGNEVATKMASFTMPIIPPLLSIPSGEKLNLGWSVKWLPQGFIESSSSRQTLPNVGIVVESRLFFDGLFSFSINVASAGYKSGENILRQGRRTIYSEIRGNNEITIIGELPSATAKRIAGSVVIN